MVRAIVLAAALLALGGCAGVRTHVALLEPGIAYAATDSVQVLLRPPERKYREIAKLESQGAVGEPETALIEDLREKARRIGAHAVILEDTTVDRRPPVVLWDPWPPPPMWYPYRWYGRGFWHDPYLFPYDQPRILPGGNAYTVRAIAIRY